jgi:transcriptional regulator with XRE-family HTH domain
MSEKQRGSQPNEWPLRRLRTKLGLSLQDLSARTGIDTAQLELIERDTGLAAPTLEQLEKLADALGCKVDNLRL